MDWALSGESKWDDSGVQRGLTSSRRGAGEDTSESETGAHGGPGPSSLRSTLAKKKPNVPTVIEP